MSKVLVTDSYLGNIANAIRSKNGALTTYRPGDMAAAIEALDTSGIHPTGTKNINQNGTHDVTQYANANVNVPNSYAAGDEGKVVSNGALVAQTAQSITENGTYDTTTNDEITVNVSGGGGGVPLIQRSAWNAMTIAQRRTYGLVAIQDAQSGYTRGVLVNGADHPLPFNGYLRTNYAAAIIRLSSWDFQYDDNFEFVFRNMASPSARGQWPTILLDDRHNAMMVVQFNFYGNRHVMNFGWNNIWSGDGNVWYESPFDYDNFYRVTKQGDVFTIYKGADIDDITTAVGTTTLNGASISAKSNHVPELFSEDSQKTLDMAFYVLRVFDANGVEIHRYMPDGSQGIVDVNTGELHVATGAGFTFVQSYNPYY